MIEGHRVHHREDPELAEGGDDTDMRIGTAAAENTHPGISTRVIQDRSSSAPAASSPATL